MAKHCVLEVVEAYYDHGHVVKRATQQAIFKYVFYTHPAHFMDVFYMVLD